MTGLLILNGLFLFGLYTALKFKLQKQSEESQNEKNLKAINLIQKYHKIRHGKLSLNDRLLQLNEFDAACDEFVESHFSSGTVRTGENVTSLSEYVSSREATIKKAGH